MSEEATPEATESDDAEVTTPDDGDTFPREVVEKLRRESAGYRERAKTAEARAEELARQLFTARVAATGKLADPTDLPYTAELLDDDDALSAAVDSLTAAKPHLKARRVAGDAGQGVRGEDRGLPTFSSLFQQ
ncbi:hypothetical protein PDG61_19210 [Mycolicibacterium sp. BiH015]|uniref:hypothetical protein n=1 Tax=Mycolicibacterium sp. BiH015 TaxID=3018808 RepID=UPI0022E86464|nr:hypothetical protein [Mycolicibacterium sp. BiH015]MDA2893059.1 hypothetical protein [Mycolicibacterium sp. BiH015]